MNTQELRCKPLLPQSIGVGITKGIAYSIIGLLSAACCCPPPGAFLSHDTARGEIHYLSDIPDSPAGQQVIIAHQGLEAASRIAVPVLAIRGQPGPGNAHGNAGAMLAAIPQARNLMIESATHCDFETTPSSACYLMTGSAPDSARTAAVHDTVIKEAVKFTQSLP